MVNLDTAIEPSSLQLMDGGTYQVVVMAIDESGICSLAKAVTTVDVTPPIEGKLTVGPEFDMVNQSIIIFYCNMFQVTCFHV